jgi:hypothetical protein
VGRWGAGLCWAREGRGRGGWELDAAGGGGRAKRGVAHSVVVMRDALPAIRPAGLLLIAFRTETESNEQLRNRKNCGVARELRRRR